MLFNEEKGSYALEDLKTALAFLDWNKEVVIFPDPQLIKIIGLANTREQEVALRTQTEKILNFARVHACMLVRCPNCDYEFPVPRSTVRAVQALTRLKPRHPPYPF
jgi:hypothetical protein